MITENYVSFEVAKLLKEKGFDGPCYKVWESHDDSQTLVGAPWFVEGETVVNRESVDAAAKQYTYEYSLNNKVDGYLAPTPQLAVKWLREVHNIGIFPSLFAFCVGEGGAAKPTYGTKIISLKSCELLTDDTNPMPTYEEACEAAIKYCLENLI